jgi:hypothetical protein
MTTVDARHVDVQEHEDRLLPLVDLESLLAVGGLEDHGVAKRHDQPAHELADVRLVVDHEDLAGELHVGRGNVIRNSVPPPGLFSARIVPPWACMIL